MEGIICTEDVVEYDGYVWRKDRRYYKQTTRRSDPNKLKEYLLHRYIYTKNFGKIQEGYCIHHKNEDKNDNSIDNLQCMSKSDHARYHTIGNQYCIGRIHSDEYKKIMSKKMKGNKNGCGGKGKKLSSETKRKMSESRKGVKKSDEAIRKMKESRKNVSVYTRRKMSEARKKYWENKHKEKEGNECN